MTVKEFFSSILDVDGEIKAMQAQRQHYLELATDTSMSLERMCNKCDVASAAVARADLTKRIEARLIEYNQLQIKASQLINQLDQSNLRRVMTLRYLCGLSWKVVSAEMMYSERHVQRLHGMALQKMSLHVIP